MNNIKQILTAGELLLSKIRQEDGYCNYSCDFFKEGSEYDPDPSNGYDCDIKQCYFYGAKLTRDQTRPNDQFMFPCCQECKDLMDIKGD